MDPPFFNWRYTIFLWSNNKHLFRSEDITKDFGRLNSAKDCQNKCKQQYEYKVNKFKMFIKSNKFKMFIKSNKFNKCIKFNKFMMFNKVHYKQKQSSLMETESSNFVNCFS